MASPGEVASELRTVQGRSVSVRLIFATAALALGTGCSPADEPEPVLTARVPLVPATDPVSLAEVYDRGAAERAAADAYRAGWEEVDRFAAAAAAAEEACTELAEPAGDAAFDAVWTERQPELDALDAAADAAFEDAGWDYNALAYQAALERREALFTEVAGEAAGAREGIAEEAFYACLEGGAA